jgi:excisionase family DNA binding protein
MLQQKEKLVEIAQLQPTKLYTPSELAPLLRITSRTIRRFCEDRVFIHASKLGCQWRIPGSDVIEICSDIIRVCKAI